MYRRIDLRYRLLYSFLSLCILVGLFSAYHVSAEGVLPRRERHRARALNAARRHYKRQYNDSADATVDTYPSASPTTDTGDSSPTSDSNGPLLGTFINNLFNDTVGGALDGFGSPAPASSSSAAGMYLLTHPFLQSRLILY